MPKISEIKRKLIKNVKESNKPIEFLLDRSNARLNIMLELVGLGKASFTELLEKTGLKPPSLNHHLKALLREGYIGKKNLNPNRRDDKKVEYYPIKKGIQALSHLINVEGWIEFYRNSKKILKLAHELFGDMTIEEFLEFNKRKATKEEEEKMKKFWEKYKHKTYKFASHTETNKQNKHPKQPHQL